MCWHCLVSVLGIINKLGDSFIFLSDLFDVFLVPTDFLFFVAFFFIAAPPSVVPYDINCKSSS